jgi:hypothetical protein
VELIEYLLSPEAAAVGPSGKSKLNEKVYTVIGIDVPVTILEYAILAKRDTLVDALLTMPDLLTKIDKDTDIIVHAKLLGMAIEGYGFKKYTDSALFTVAGITLDKIYELLDYAVRRTLPTLVFKILADRGVNTVNPGGDDEADPTKIDIYHIYFEAWAHPPENRYVTLYRRAEIIGQYAYEDLEAAVNLIKDIIAGYNGNITAKEQRAIFKRKLIDRAAALAEFNKPPEGPFRDGEPATEAAAFAVAKEGNTKWAGFSKADEEISLQPIFLEDYQTPEGTTVRPSLDVTFCPLCNDSVGRTAGCAYMYHTCKPEDILDIDLYNKYKITVTDPAGQISYKTYWCTICNRIASDHAHYRIANIFGPKPAVNEQQTDFEVFQNDCGHLGGGGLLEKIGRFDAMREECKKLLSEGAARKISRKEARLRIGKAFWNAPIAPYVARATALKAAAKWNNDPFTTPTTTVPTVEVEPVFNEIVPYNDENGTLLPEVLFVPTEATANTLDPENPAIRYRHRKPNGEIELHEGMYFGANGLFNSLLLHSSFLAANFGHCPLCPTVLHPDEIYYILNEISESENITTQQLFDFNDIYIKYKRAYQMKYYLNKEETALKRATAMIAAAYADAFENNANAAGGGNKNNNKKNNKRNSQMDTFPQIEDGVCSFFGKTKGGKRPRTIKRIKLRRRVTRIRPLYVVKKQSRRQRRSTRRKVRQ